MKVDTPYRNQVILHLIYAKINFLYSSKCAYVIRIFTFFCGVNVYKQKLSDQNKP